MNILFLTSTLPRYNSDSQAPFVLEQALAWKRFRNGDNITILAPHDHNVKKSDQIEGIFIKRFIYFLPTKLEKLAYPAMLPNIRNNPILSLMVPFYCISMLISAYKIIRSQNIDLIYAHWVMPQGLIASLLKLITKTPYILQNHSSDVEIFKRLPFFGKSLLKYIIKNSTVLFCVNVKLKNEAISLWPKSNEIGHDHISVLPMGSYVNLKENNNNSFAYDFGFIGRLSKKKGVIYFLRALNSLKNRGFHCRTAIAGDGEEMDSLRKYCKSNNLNVDFLGFVTHEKKLNFIYDTRIFVFPSVEFKGDREGLPVAIIEALNLKKIIIASENTNLRDLDEFEKIKDSVYILNNPEDLESFEKTLIQIINLSDLESKAISERTYLFTKRYLWDNLIKEYYSEIKKRLPAT